MTAIKLHIPLAQYEFLEMDFEGSPEEAIEESNRIKKFYETSLQEKGQGLSVQEWNKALDGYLSSQSVDVDFFERMSERQSRMFNELKKAFARLSNKHGYKD